jgi:NAD-dependent deacetylase
VVIGTSLQVYPAAGLVGYAPRQAEKYLVDPDDMYVPAGFTHVKETATNGISILKRKLLDR